MSKERTVCHIQYHIGNQPRVSYALYAEDEDSQISILRRSTWTIKMIDFPGSDLTTHSEIEVAVSPEQADEFDRWLSWFPEPQPLHMDVSSFGNYEKYNNYWVTLHNRYGEKSYSRGWGFIDFVLPNHSYDQWETKVNQLIDSFEELTGNLNQLRPRLGEAIESYKQVFHNHGKYNKYQARWKTPTNTYGYYYTYYRSYLNGFENEDISDDYLRQLDYRHYLPRFLWLIAFQDAHLQVSNRNDSMVVFQKIGETDFSSWDEDEQEALHNYFKALWDYVLAYYPPLGIDAYTFVHGVGLAGADVTPYIEHWKQEFHRVEVSRHMAGYVGTLFEHYVQDGVTVFDTVPKILRRWLGEIEEGSYFLKRFVEYDGVRPFADEFADASEALDLIGDAGL